MWTKIQRTKFDKRDSLCVCVMGEWEEGIVVGKKTGRLASEGQIMECFKFQA